MKKLNVKIKFKDGTEKRIPNVVEIKIGVDDIVIRSEEYDKLFCSEITTTIFKDLVENILQE